jgi:curved DNA-binding protein CbpA
MNDHFLTLDLPRCAALSPDAVRTAFQQAAANVHPDKATDDEDRAARTARFALLNEAQAVLSSLPRRLLHLAELLTGEKPHTGRLDGKLMSLFSRVDAALHFADALIAKRTASPSALQRALLAPECMAVLEKLESCAAEAMGQLDEIRSELPGIDALALEDPAKAAAACASAGQTAAFLTKWESEIRQRGLQLVH